MTEKRCYTCKHFEFGGDAYFLIEHCKLHDKYPKNSDECLEVCDDWTKSELRREYAKFLLSLQCPMSYEVWCYLHAITDLRDDLNE